MKVRTVILVHGVGEQRKGEFLETVLEPLLRFLRSNFHRVRADVLQRPEEGPARAIVSFADERWEIWEAWWAQAFYPQPKILILRWAWRALGLNLANYLVGTLPFLHGRLWLAAARAFYPRERRRVVRAIGYWVTLVPKGLVLLVWAMVLAVLHLLLLLLGALLELVLWLLHRLPGSWERGWGNPVWPLVERLTTLPEASPSPRGGLPGPTISVWSRLYDLIAGLSFTIVFTFAYLPLLATATVLYLIALLPAWLVFPRWLGAAAAKVTTYLVEGFGDQYALMYTETAASSIRQRLADLLEPYLDRHSPGYRPCEGLTVIAHSAGATVALGVLSDPRSWERWTGQTWNGHEWTNGHARTVPVTLMTVGSSLTVSHENVPGHPMFQQPLPPWVTWVDLWARYDPVPHGPPSQRLLQAVHDPAGRFETIRVVNRDTPFGDHSAYWTNHEEVLSLFLHEITGHPDLGSSDQDEVEKAFVVRQALDRIDYRRLRVSLVNLLGVGLIGGFALVAGIGGGLFTRIGGRVLGVASDALGWPGPLRGLQEALGRAYGGVRDGLPAWLSAPLPASWEAMGQALGRAADFLVGVGLFALGAYLLVQLALLLFGALRYRDPWGRPEKLKGRRRSPL